VTWTSTSGDESAHMQVPAPQTLPKPRKNSVVSEYFVPTIENDGIVAVLTHKGITPIDLNEEIVYGSEIGKGAFGVVLRCKFRDTDCAIKQLRLPTVGTPRAEQHKGARASVAVLEGLLSEFDTMMTLRHPNVLLTMGIAVDPYDQTAGIVNELMQASLFDIIYEASFRPYATWDQAYLAIASDVAKGMSFIHFSGLLHRDLKPANVLIDARWVAKVADFGSVQDGSTAGECHQVEGTPPYMAPEILQSATYEKATDVWAFGSMLAHMGTGKLPYQQLGLKDRHELFAVIRSGEISPIHLLLEAADTPTGILDLAKACCTPERSQRPTFKDIATKFNSMLSDDTDMRPLVRIRDRKVLSAARVSTPAPYEGEAAGTLHSTYKAKFQRRSSFSSPHGSPQSSSRAPAAPTEDGQSGAASDQPTDPTSSRFVDTFSSTMLRTWTPGENAKPEETTRL